MISTSVLFLSNPASNEELPDRSLYEHNIFSINLENLILPSPEHTTQIFSDYGMIISFYTFFDKPVHQLQIENLVFLGYSVIFLSALAVIRYRQNHIWFWLLICGIFVVMSLGPELKIFNEPTGIVLPDKVFYDAVPEWDEIRASARFIVMTNLALAILASYAVYGLIKNKFSSFKQQLVLTTIIGFVILFEFSMIPFPSFSEPIPSVYEEIKNDESKFAVLAAPIGGTGDMRLMSNPEILYHQIYHEKPIYGGFESRIPLDILDETRTYFFNMFHKYGSKNDIIKQDLAIHGLSLFDHFDIKYLTVHKTAALGTTKVIDINKLMSEILNENVPIYQDGKMVVYKIPKPNSLKPFLLLGSGWHAFDPENHVRATMKNSEILIVNPTNFETHITLNLVLSSIEKEKTMTIYMNNEELDRVNIPTTSKNLQIENLILKPGINIVTFDTNAFTLVEYGLKGIEIGKGQKTTMSFNVRSITIQP